MGLLECKDQLVMMAQRVPQELLARVLKDLQVTMAQLVRRVRLEMMEPLVLKDLQAMTAL